MSSQKQVQAIVTGAVVAQAVNPLGDNRPANFTRGVAMYITDPELRAKRTGSIESNKAAAKAELLNR